MKNVASVSLAPVAAGILCFQAVAADAVGETRAASAETFYYGRRLEPTGRRILHGAGQDAGEFRKYYEAVGERKPLIYMLYAGLKSDPTPHLERERKRIEEYSDEYLLPQIGLSMTRDGKPEQHYEHEVAAGKYDENIEALCRWLKRLNRPAFLRIGYEFNGHWNGYEPQTYVAAWRRIVAALRKHELDEVATVWCATPGSRKNYMDYYPGDEFVDWWGIDIFGRDHLSDPITHDLVAKARKRKFPVMIGESTPRGVGVLEGQKSWDKWFAPYFDFMHRNPHIKAFCYISWDWSKYEMWKDWGDARVAQNPDVLKLYRDELRDPVYFHSASATHIRRALMLPESRK
jgi:hypothetical protein